MQSIPDFSSPYSYIGVFLLTLGIILILSGVEILVLEKMKITPGKRTWIVGILGCVLGIGILLISSPSNLNSSNTTDFVPSLMPSVTPETLDFEPISANEYTLIPLQVGRRSNINDKDDPDKNLSLRAPELMENIELSLIDSIGQVDFNGPQFWYVFEPEFISAYSLKDSNGVRSQTFPQAVGIRTSPGATITIPQREPTIYQGKYLAMVLFADEDSLAFVYSREDGVENGYAIYYEGIQVDPNLLELYEESQGDFLPGLVAGEPVGWASDTELIISIRLDGEFKDVRLKRDWWQGFGG
ncbi:MAG: hypothetical protein AAF490_16395 [Chloroflexota bacterium]